MLFQLVLVITILQQSLVGVVDAHSSHQSDNQHQEIVNHIHETVEFMTERLELPDAKNDSLDCHHCCHCHSPTYSVFPDAASHFDVIKPAANFPSYRLEPLASLPVSLYRPPIA